MSRTLWLVSGIILGAEIALWASLAVGLFLRRLRQSGRDLMALIDATREEHDWDCWERELDQEQQW